MNLFTTTHALACAAALALLVATSPAGAQQCDCPGDLNFDNHVDGGDLGVLLGDWATTAGRSDFNNDGTVDGADLGLLLGAWGGCPMASNDNCANAIWIGEGQHGFCTNGTNTDGPSLGSGTCGIGTFNMGHDVWYRYQATINGVLTVTTCGAASFDTVIAVYHTPSGVAGCPGAGGAVLVGCNDDDYSNCSSVDSVVSVNVTAGHIYTIRVGGFEGASGSGTLTVAMGYFGSSPQTAIQAGSGAVSVVTGYTGDGDSTTDYPQNCSGPNPPGPREWIRYDATCNGIVTATTCSGVTNFDTILTVVEHTPASPGTWWENFVMCNDDSAFPNCQIGGINRKSRVQFPVLAGRTYYFIVSGYSGSWGNYELTINMDCQ